MGIKVTEFQKGRAKFEKLFKSGAINSAGIKITLSSSEILEIFDKGSCEMLDTLNDIGEHFAKSWRTRLTSHKNYDFTLLQSKSSLNVQDLYREMFKVRNKFLEREKPLALVDTLVPVKDLPNNDLKKRLSRYDKQIAKAYRQLLRAIDSDPKLRDRIWGEFKDHSLRADGGKVVNIVTSKLNSDVKFIGSHSEKLMERDDYSDWVGGMMFASSTVPVFVAASGAYIGLAVIGGALAGLASGLAFGCAVLALLCLATSLVIGATGIVNRLMVIKNKKYIKRVQDKSKELIKCINDADKYVRDFVKNIPGRRNITPFGDDKIPTEVIKVTTEFVNMQKKLWEPYTTATGREYDERFTLPHGEHVSGMRSVPDTKQHSEIGRAKLGLANTWVKMSVNVGT